jgi:hypothetical protein
MAGLLFSKFGFYPACRFGYEILYIRHTSRRENR